MKLILFGLFVALLLVACTKLPFEPVDVRKPDKTTVYPAPDTTKWWIHVPDSLIHRN